MLVGAYGSAWRFRFAGRVAKEFGARQRHRGTQNGRTRGEKVVLNGHGHAAAVPDGPRQDQMWNHSVPPVQVVVGNRAGRQRAAKTRAGHRSQSVAAFNKWDTGRSQTPQSVTAAGSLWTRRNIVDPGSPTYGPPSSLMFRRHY